MDISNRILSAITVYMKYSRFIPKLNRRETWEELVSRNKEMHQKKYPKLKDEIENVYKFVYEKKVLPSMRSLQFGGKPIEISPNRIYNCAYMPIDDWRAFGEVMFLLLGGTGVGYSVQKHHVEKLPEIRKPKSDRERRFLVSDSIEGWADAIKALVKSYFISGSSLRFDYSDIRPKGARLITSGGKAPGAEPLRICIEKLRVTLDLKKDGDKLTPIEVHDMVCYIADAVLAGGIRRAALISLFSADDDEMISCKFGTWWELNPQRGRANNSAVLLRSKVTEEFFKGLWKKIELSNAGEPGIYFSNDKDWGTNPCLSADTKIAVADGRGSVSIGELAQSGEDVPVYSVNRFDGKVSIEWARSPRKTRTNVQLVRVHLDDGTHLDVTPDHGMLLRDGTRVEAKDLTEGDSLSRFTKRQEYVAKTNPHKYWRVYCDTRNTKADKIYEHRMITKFYQPDVWDKVYDETKSNGWVNGGLVVHHKDYNPLNNRPENLQIMTFKEHTEYHAQHDNGGEQNSMYSGYTNEQIEEFALQLTKDYGRKVSSNEWKIAVKQNGMPQSFSSWRRSNWFPSPSSLLSWCASQLGYDNVDPRVARQLAKVQSNGYDAYIKDGAVFVKKSCGNPSCNDELHLHHSDKHAVYCSTKCATSTEEHISTFIKRNRDGQINKQQITFESQIKIFNELKETLGRDPKKIEWETACKDTDVSGRIRTEIPNNFTNPYVFHTYNQLKETASTYNHKVVRVENLEGLHDVYNLTVDSNHTVGIVTNDSNDQMSGIFVTQCCEIALRPFQFCNLCEVNVSDVVDQEDLEARTKAATFIGTLQATYTDFHYLRPIWQRTTEKDALLGVGMTGIGSGVAQKLDVKAAAKIAKEENERVANLLGINKAARITTIKPAGTSSLTLGCSSGIHAWHNDYYLRRIRVGKNESIYTHLSQFHPELVEDEYFRPHDTAVIGIPQKAPDSAIMRTESPLQLLERVKWFNQNWIKPGHKNGMNTHNISATVSVREHEWDAVGNWMWLEREHFNGLSVLPFDGGNYIQAPFEDITKEKYEQLMQTLNDVDLSKVVEFDDNTDLAGEIACGSSGCEIK